MRLFAQLPSGRKLTLQAEGAETVAELKERAPDILLVNAMSARRQGGIFDRKKAGEVLQPCLQ